DIALRDCGINAFLIAGVAMEVGIEPTVRHAADLGYIPIVVTDACGCGHAEAADRALGVLRYAGDALFTDVAEICDVLQRRRERRGEQETDRWLRRFCSRISSLGSRRAGTTAVCGLPTGVRRRFSPSIVTGTGKPAFACRLDRFSPSASTGCVTVAWWSCR